MDSRWLALAAAAVCLSGCVVHVSTGPTRHSTQDYERGSTEKLRVELRMGAGELKVRGGADQLAHTDFMYNVDAWRPDVRFHPGANAELIIEQPGKSHTTIGNTKYNWDVQLADDVPTEIVAHFGAGDANLDLGTLDLRRVEVEMGVGELRMDLRGKPKKDYDVRIRGGVGEATIRLPHDAGVYATGRGGIGEVKAEGLRKEGDHWINDAYDTANVRVHVDVEGGIGSITLIGN